MFNSAWLGICVRTERTYSVVHECFLPPAVNVRMGKRLWSTGKGWRKLGTA